MYGKSALEAEREGRRLEERGELESTLRLTSILPVSRPFSRSMHPPCLEHGACGVIQSCHVVYFT
jgi:hypothetical protein